MQSVYFCLKSNVLLSRPERDEEAVKKRKQEKKKISAEAKVHSGWEKLSWRPRFTIWQNLFWVTVAHTSHTRSKENQPINVVDDGNYQVRKKQYNFFVQARKKEMRRKMRQKLKGREGRWAINSSLNKTIRDGGITVDFWIVKVHTSNWSSNSWGSSNNGGSSYSWDRRIPLDHLSP